MRKLTAEQIKFAKWVGFKKNLRGCYSNNNPQAGYVLCDDKTCPHNPHFAVWTDPRGQSTRILPDFKGDPIMSLYECFEWFAPELWKRGLDIELFSDTTDCYFAHIHKFGESYKPPVAWSDVAEENPAVAFSKAVDMLIGLEKLNKRGKKDKR